VRCLKNYTRRTMVSNVTNLDEIIEETIAPEKYIELFGEEASKLISASAISQAEELVGESYISSIKTKSLAVLLAQHNSRLRQAKFAEFGDTFYPMPVMDLLNITKNEGFSIVTSVFDYSHVYDLNDVILILFNPALAALLCVTTCNMLTNDVTLYFNWKPNRELTTLESFRIVGPGYTKDGVFISYLRVLDGFRYRLNLLKVNGDFVSPWVDIPFIELVNYPDMETCSSLVAITETRLNNLPIKVRALMKP